MSSYRTDILPPSGDEISLRSLPAAVHQQQNQANHNQHQQLHQVDKIMSHGKYQGNYGNLEDLSNLHQIQNLTNNSILQPHPSQRSMSPVSAVVGGEEPQKGRRSSRRRPHLEKQVRATMQHVCTFNPELNLDFNMPSEDRVQFRS